MPSRGKVIGSSQTVEHGQSGKRCGIIASSADDDVHIGMFPQNLEIGFRSNLSDESDGVVQVGLGKLVCRTARDDFAFIEIFLDAGFGELCLDRCELDVSLSAW